MRKAYLDCSAGISGDMFLAALIDAGVAVDKLFGELKKLPLGFYEFKRTRALRGGLMGTRVDIRVPGEQPHRHLAEILALIEKAALPEKAAALAVKAFNQLAEVEGKLHNIPADEIHFHEVGAVDAIIDIVGTCVGMELLGISELICSPLNVGDGQIKAAHGTLPVPAPATAELLKDIPIYSSGVQGELVTPTGAVLVATLAASFGPLPPMKVAKIGYGAGEKDFPDHPNIARLFVGEAIEPVTAEAGPPGDELASVVEAVVDEMSPQAYSTFLENVRAAGALDVTCGPARFDNNRPGLSLRILCNAEKVDAISQVVLEQTSAADVCIADVRRKVTARERPPEEAPRGDEVVTVIEANVDDMSPQLYGYFLERALAAGALDVTCSSAQMKKNRPGLTISILCHPCKNEALTQLLFEQTTTIGVRMCEARRKVLEREQVAVDTPYGTVQVKVAHGEGKVLNAAPEFDDCRRLAMEKSVPLKQVIAAAEAAYLQQAGNSANES